MRASVAAAWPAFCKTYEGVCSWMYLDTKLKVTTGVGFLIDSIPAAQALTWWKTGTRASPAEVEAEWRQIKSRVEVAPRGGYAFRQYANLHMVDADINRLLLDVTAQFWARLGQSLPALEQFPADAQLALIDEAYQNGPAFLDTKSRGQYVWAGTRAALLAGDFAAAATHVPGSGARAERRKTLYRNAAEVILLDLDPERLWDGETPHLEDEVTPADLDKIAALIDAKLAGLAEEVAAATWAADVIPSADPNPANPTSRPDNYLRAILLTARQARDAVKALVPKV